MPEPAPDRGGQLRQAVRASLRDAEQRRLQVTWAAINDRLATTSSAGT